MYHVCETATCTLVSTYQCQHSYNSDSIIIIITTCTCVNTCITLYHMLQCIELTILAAEQTCLC